MNRYETVLRRNVARNLYKLTTAGITSEVNKSKLTRFEISLTYQGSLTTKQIADVVNRYSRDVLSHVRSPSFKANITPDVEKRLLADQFREAENEEVSPSSSRAHSSRKVNAITDNEITKAKNWSSQTPSRNLISSVKIALIRDWLVRIDFYVEYFAVSLDNDERFYSVVDFLTDAHDRNRDLQERMISVVPEDNHALRGEYFLFRKSLNDSKLFVKANMRFEKSPVGRHGYEMNAKLNRGSQVFEASGEGYYFYSNSCFLLTGRYSVFIDGTPRTMIDHYVLHDDSNNAQLEGLWNTIFLGNREPRAVPVALFRKKDHPDLLELERSGRVKDLPNEIRERLATAKGYYQ